MNKTSIEWATHTWNPVVGCRRGCEYCYAKRIFHRFNPTKKFEDLEFYPNRMNQPHLIKKPSRIFVGSMTDICYWTQDWLAKVLIVAQENPWHTFMFLTKDGKIYLKHNFPKNCWLGTTITSTRDVLTKTENNINFISIEPLINKMHIPREAKIGMDWIIIGGLTPKPIHKKEWVDSLIYKARSEHIPVFLKNNLHYPVEIKYFP